MNSSKVFLTFAVVFLVTTGVTLFRNGKVTLQIAMAEEQVKVFESMRLKALGAPAGEAIECLDYVRNYYPSGTKQAAGSRLDNIVESARGAATREIIAHLRIKTGKDFGDDPSKWKATEIHN